MWLERRKKNLNKDFIWWRYMLLTCSMEKHRMPFSFRVCAVVVYWSLLLLICRCAYVSIHIFLNVAHRKRYARSLYNRIDKKYCEQFRCYSRANLSASDLSESKRLEIVAFLLLFLRGMRIFHSSNEKNGSFPQKTDYLRKDLRRMPISSNNLNRRGKKVFYIEIISVWLNENGKSNEKLVIKFWF